MPPVRRPGVFHIHVMKTGGTSMTRMFHAHFGPEQRYPSAADPRTRRQEKITPRILVGLSSEQRAQLAFVSVHMGAWLAEEVFPDHLRVTVLRDPVERTISHLRQIADLPQTPDDLEAIYDDPIWRPRLLDHQVQVFAASREDMAVSEAGQQSYDPAQYEEPERTRIRHLLWAAFTTTIGIARTIDERSYAEAAARLDRVDEVGVTERLDEVMARVAERLGWERTDLRRDNVSDRRTEVPPGLRERIERDNHWDRMLYERALTRRSG